MKQISFCILVALVTLSACKSTKKINSAINKPTVGIDSTAKTTSTGERADSTAFKADILRKVHANKVDCNWFSAKIKADYDDKSGDNNNLNVNIRIQKDSIIWVSITKKVLGIDFEGLRVLATKDSVKVLNKQDKVIQYRSIAYLQELTQLPFDFYTLQDLILGNPIFFAENVVSVKRVDKRIQALSIGKLFKHLITIDTTNNNIVHSKLDDVNMTRNRTCDITLDKYENKNGKVFSTDRYIVVTEKSKLDIHLDFKQYSFDEAQTFPFSVPKNYTVK